MLRLTRDGSLEATTGELIDDAIGRLERLTADLEALRDGAVPTEADILRDAPGLDQWSVAALAVPCLVGRTWGHPTLPGTGRPIRTSDIWVMAEDHGAVRTISRQYRLGRPADQAETALS
ncbi:DUF6634 family protein [Microvirga tunisiensis]|uniref:Uncharacterized protein n=1 Tax=Microvirga tunisiensis TaxID=2108360 RepID=A0A5N7MH47_9HYPH|nr:DUF6634 family protein [Microvirga tunisiensis]MPR06207.1 hypothetical protein [Microvirga tunisiensis]MPR26050.1 hypothetical protein [Microvirga tunisiensis]